MIRKALNPYIRIALLMISIALIAPATIIFILGAILIFLVILVIPADIVMVLFMTLSGVGLFSSWKIVFNMEEYCRYGAPFGIYFGTAVGCVALIIMFNTSNSLNFSDLLDNTITTIVFGVGPLISSVASLLIISFMRRDN